MHKYSVIETYSNPTFINKYIFHLPKYVNLITEKYI